MLGLWRYMLKVPPFLWEKQISKAKKKFEAENSFMTREHGLGGGTKGLVSTINNALSPVETRPYYHFMSPLSFSRAKSCLVSNLGYSGSFVISESEPEGVA